MDKKITKLAIFDFDGTLIDTPLEIPGRIHYQEKTGKPYPNVGWWGRYETLDMEVFDMPVVDHVIQDYEKEVAGENTAVILLTGRMVKLTNHVMTILKAKNLKFDEYHFNRGGTTDYAKVKSMTELLEKYTDVTEIEQWEDRVAHIPIFQEFGDKMIASGRLKKYKINLVPSTHHGE